MKTLAVKIFTVCVSIFQDVMTEKFLRWLILFMFKQYCKHTKTTVDDKIIEKIEETLNGN